MLRSRNELPPEAQELVKTIIDSAPALVARVAPHEFEQRFEFAWGHSRPLDAEGAVGSTVRSSTQVLRRSIQKVG